MQSAAVHTLNATDGPAAATLLMPPSSMESVQKWQLVLPHEVGSFAIRSAFVMVAYRRLEPPSHRQSVSSIGRHWRW